MEWCAAVVVAVVVVVVVVVVSGRPAEVESGWLGRNKSHRNIYIFEKDRRIQFSFNCLLR